MTQPLPEKARCSTGPGANAIKSRAKYTRRFMLPMAKLIGQIECYKFQQQTDDLPPTLITADSHWSAFWGEQTLWTGLCAQASSVVLGQCDLVRARHISGWRGRETSCCELRPKTGLRCFLSKAAPRQNTLKQPQLRGVLAVLAIPSQHLNCRFESACV